MATYTGSDKAISYLFTASNNTAEEYDAAGTYAAGDFAMYEGVLYICTTAIVTPESFDPAKWTQTTIMENTGGGGTNVVANPAGAATETLNKLQVGAIIYDVPSGGGSSGHSWSTTEHIVGTWTDGKTVYERTFIFGGADMNGTWTISDGFGTLFYLPYGDEISEIWFDLGNSFVYSSTSASISQTITFPVVLGGPSGSYARSCIQRNPAVNNGKMVINFQTTFPSGAYNMRNNLKYIFTFRYTKTA